MSSPSRPPSEDAGAPTVGRIRLKRAVASEPLLGSVGLGRAADRGEYPCTMNPQGAVCAVLGDGSLLGVKPDEFEFVAITAPLTNRQRGAWLMLDVDLDQFVSGSAGREAPSEAKLEETARWLMELRSRHAKGPLTGAHAESLLATAERLLASLRASSSAPDREAPKYYGKDCPVGMVQVEFVGCSPCDRISDYGWMPVNHTFLDLWVDGRRFRVNLGTFHDGVAVRRGLHIVTDTTVQCEKTSINAASLFFSDAPAALPDTGAAPPSHTDLMISPEAIAAMDFPDTSASSVPAHAAPSGERWSFARKCVQAGVDFAAEIAPADGYELISARLDVLAHRLAKEPDRAAQVSGDSPNIDYEYEELCRVSQLLVDFDPNTTHATVSGHLAELLDRFQRVSGDSDETARGVALIAAERKRQIEGSPEDDKHPDGLLADSALLLIERWRGYATFYDALPCAFKLADRHRDDPIRLLTIAGAFVAAEIDRLLRAARSSTPSPGSDQ